MTLELTDLCKTFKFALELRTHAILKVSDLVRLYEYVLLLSKVNTLLKVTAAQ